LTLINDILDLSKIESGTVVVDVSEVRLDDLHGFVERTFRHVAEAKGVDFHIQPDPNLPTSMFTDSKRLQQILKNLLSNAFKFTHHGAVTLTIARRPRAGATTTRTSTGPTSVLSLSVSDTGIGIPADKQQIIFEAFQQADGSTSRKYGGNRPGPGDQPRAVAAPGGEIRLASSPGRGSTFTLYLPQTYAPSRPGRRSSVGLSEPPRRCRRCPSAAASVSAAPRPSPSWWLPPR